MRLRKKTNDFRVLLRINLAKFSTYNDCNLFTRYAVRHMLMANNNCAAMNGNFVLQNPNFLEDYPHENNFNITCIFEKSLYTNSYFSTSSIFIVSYFGTKKPNIHSHNSPNNANFLTSHY